jgi:hypothetical protein
VNPEILRAAGLITRERQPVKILGAGEVSVPLFVLADAFTASARTKVEAAGGSVQTIAAPAPAVETIQVAPARRSKAAEAKAAAAEARVAEASDASAEETAESEPATAEAVEPVASADAEPDASTEAEADPDAAPQA